MATTQGGGEAFPWSLTPMPLDPLFTLVRTVDDLAIGFTEGEAPAAVISAAGTVPTGGWQFGILAPKLSTPEKQADQVWELLFLGRLPPKDALVLQRITRIEANLVKTIPFWAKAVRVIASGGEQVLALPSSQSARLKTLAVNSQPLGGVDIFPW